jgi:IS4 transposase
MEPQMPKPSQRQKIEISTIHDFVDGIFGEDMHAKRVQSLACATLGVVQSCSLAVHLIGQGLSQANELKQKHCVKQVDRLLSNPKLDVWELFMDWVPFVVGARNEIFVALDWTDFDSDGHSTIMLSIITGHGRATPLIWSSVEKSTLKNFRNLHEEAVLLRLYETLPKGVRVTVLADRGFCDADLYRHLGEDLGFDYIIRFRDCITITDGFENSLPASEWVPDNGRICIMRDMKVTQKKLPLPVAVFVKRKEMKDAWCLASSRKDLKGQEIVEWYGRRWGIETSFRDMKNYRFGMGMGDIHTKSCDRRDRLFMISALAIALLTLLGAAGESVGLEKNYKANTSKKRTYSLFRQGTMYYGHLYGMKEQDAESLINKFHEILAEHAVFRKILGII